MTTQTASSTWNIDAGHSIADFSVKHMMVSTLKGRFATLEALSRGDVSDPLTASVTATLDVASITTNDETRDAHLRSDDFFNAEKFPAITFTSKRVERVDAENYRLVGDLTIRDVTREVVLDTEFEGQVADPWGNQRAGFTATTQISRGEFGVNFNGLLETGGVIVSDKVKITLHIELVRKP